MKEINKEAFEGVIFLENNNNNNDNNELSDADKNNNNNNNNSELIEFENNLYKSLDQVKITTQVVVLPLILLVFLGISYFFVTTTTAISTTTTAIDYSIITQIIPIISFVSNFFVSFLFSKVEIQWILNQFNNNNNNNNNNSNKNDNFVVDEKQGKNNTTNISIIISLIITIIAFLNPIGSQYFWPVQNLINIFITITITRAFQLQQLPLILLLLLLLIGYDVFAVLGTKSFTDNGNSVMEAVAATKM